MTSQPAVPKNGFDFDDDDKLTADRVDMIRRVANELTAWALLVVEQRTVPVDLLI